MCVTALYLNIEGEAYHYQYTHHNNRWLLHGGSGLQTAAVVTQMSIGWHLLTVSAICGPHHMLMNTS